MKQDNLNRIRGILSARLGALVPKFTPGGLFLYKKLKNGKFVYSNDNGASWFKDAQFTQLYDGILNTKFWQTESMRFDPEDLNNETNASLDYVSYAQEMQNKLAKRNKVSTAIPGATDVENNPNAAVDAAVREKVVVETEKTSNRAAKQARKLELSEQGIAWQKANLNENGLTTNLQNRIDRIAANNLARADMVEQRILDRNTVTVDERNQTLGLIGQGLSSGILVVGDAFGAEQAATDSNLTKGLDMGFDATADIASLFGPVGLAIGGAMKIAGAAGDIIQGITGGNDQMTTADKVLSSSWLNWTPIGIANDLFGKNSDTFATDIEALETVGSSYGGTASDISEAAANAGKKYGLFSSNARKRANYTAKQVAAKQGLMSDIADTARDQRLAVQSMGEQAGLVYSMMTDGGYNQKYTYAAKHGGIITQDIIEFDWSPSVTLNWELPVFKDGGSVEFVEKLDWVPEFKDGNKIRTIEELIEYAKKENPRFIQRLSEKRKGIEFLDENGNKISGSHLLSFFTDDSGAVVFPRIQEMEDGSLKYFSNWRDASERAIANNNILRMTPEEAKLFTESGEDENGDLFGYKAGWPEFFFPEDLSEYPEEYRKFKMSLPKNQKFTPESEYRTYLYWQLWGKPKDFNYTKTHPSKDGVYMYNWDESDESYHASSVAWGDGVGYFMKPKHHTTVGYELDWYNKGLITEEGGKQREMTPEERKEWEEFRSNYELVDDGDFYKYIPKNKKGGSLGDSDIPETEETTQKNVIPEGALHKNKHHMEHAEGLTKKGIPVIDEEGEQQAEIEHSEIIFTLEVTKKLEEYYEIFYSENATNKEKEQAALDAGKLLVYQILENTEDRTGLIESCKQGGSLTLQKSQII